MKKDTQYSHFVTMTSSNWTNYIHSRSKNQLRFFLPFLSLPLPFFCSKTFVNGFMRYIRPFLFALVFFPSFLFREPTNLHRFHSIHWHSCPILAFYAKWAKRFLECVRSSFHVFIVNGIRIEPFDTWHSSKGVH